MRQGFEEKTLPQFACAQAALPNLRKDGSITFISAVTGQAAVPMSAGIAAANAAIAAVVPVLAVELKPLRVNAVSPGLVSTPFWGFLPEHQRKEMFDQYAVKTLVGAARHATRNRQFSWSLMASLFAACVMWVFQLPAPL